MAIHTWPELYYFSCDLYSCKEFDLDTAIEYLTECFHIQDAAILSVTRSDEVLQHITNPIGLSELL